jgi:hypothetical protein
MLTEVKKYITENLNRMQFNQQNLFEMKDNVQCRLLFCLLNKKVFDNIWMKRSSANNFIAVMFCYVKLC